MTGRHGAAGPAPDVVPSDWVRAVIAHARHRGVDVADVPVAELAGAAGVSRSTLLRRLGGSRQALDDAVRAAGVDPGGRRPVRDRAIDAAAALISEQGLGAVTLETVASAAGCSLPSLHVTFGGRDGLLGAVYERFSPLTELSAAIGPGARSLPETVRAVYAALIASLERQPAVAPAMLSELFARPHGPVAPIFGAYFPLVLDRLGGWLEAEQRAGRIRAVPVPLLIQQLIGPLTVHLLLRPALAVLPDIDLPTVEEAREVFVDAFVRAAAVPAHGGADDD